jgi:hypothetical protein
VDDSREHTRRGAASRVGRVRLLVGALVVAVAVGVWVGVTHRSRELPPPLAPPSRPVLPNLTMEPLTELFAGTGDETERPYVFFTATIANAGRGPFEVHAVRATERDRWRVSQRFREPDDARTELVIPEAELVFGGHGHVHWHVHLGASYTLLSSTGTVLRAYEKVGFCFFDQLRAKPAPPFAPAEARFPKTSCDGEETTELDMGLSPGWTDPYQWTLPDQRLEVQGLPDGVYRLVARADPGNWFRESNERDNEVWVDLRLKTSVSPAEIDVLGSGPAR